MLDTAPPGFAQCGFANTILSGWHAGGIVTFTSGFPFSPLLGYDPSNTGSVGLLRANLAFARLLADTALQAQIHKDSSLTSAWPHADRHGNSGHDLKP